MELTGRLTQRIAPAKPASENFPVLLLPPRHRTGADARGEIRDLERVLSEIAGDRVRIGPAYFRPIIVAKALAQSTA
jgi:hypothetical protein